MSNDEYKHDEQPSDSLKITFEVLRTATGERSDLFTINANDPEPLNQLQDSLFEEDYELEQEQDGETYVGTKKYMFIIQGLVNPHTGEIKRWPVPIIYWENFRSLCLNINNPFTENSNA